MTLRHILLIASFISVLGCATNLHSSSEDAASEITYRSGELNGETLFDILSAELAVNQDNFAYSLDKYLKQAKLTNDAGIAKRAVRIAQHLRDTKSLIRAAELWSKAAPLEAEPQQILASVYITQREFSKALPHFNKALDLGQNKVLLLLTSQIHKMNKKEIGLYIELLESVKVKKELDVDRLITLGILQNRVKEHKKALKSFNLALKTNKDQPSAVFQKARTLKNLQKYKEALATLSILTSKKSDDRQYNSLEIQLLFLLKKDTKALSKINASLERNPNDTPLHNYLALTALDFDHLKESKSIFQNLLISSPENTDSYFYLGIIAERDKLLPLAIENYLKVTNGNNTLQAHTRAISLHKDAGDKASVEKISQDLIKQYPTQKNTYVLMQADWLNKFKFQRDALNLLDSFIDAEPDNTEFLYARATYLEPTNFPAAEIDFKKVLQLKPNNAVVLNAYGYTLTIHTTQYTQAYDLIEKALKIKPEDPATIDSMGWVLFKLKRYKEAIEYLSKAYILYDDPEVASHLIAALASNKELDRANKIYQKISKNHPDNKFVEQARKSLENLE